MPFCEKICIVVSPDMKVTIDFQSFCNATPAEQLDCICELCASNIYLLLPKFNLKWEFHFLLFTARKQSLGQGNIFRSVCQEFCSRGGGSASVHAGIPSPGPATTPHAVHAGRYGQQTGGMHPTGMQSCSPYFSCETHNFYDPDSS